MARRVHVDLLSGFLLLCFFWGREQPIRSSGSQSLTQCSQPHPTTPSSLLCSFIDDPADRELEVIVAFLEDIANCSDVRPHCPRWREWEKKEPGARHHHHHHHRHQGKAGKGKGEGEGKAKGVQAG